MKPHIWYSNYHDSYFVGFKDTKEPTSRYPSLDELKDDWRNASGWFERRYISERANVLRMRLAAL